MTVPSAMVKTAVFSVLVPGTVAGLIPKLLARYDREAPSLDSRIARSLGRVSFVLGLLLYLHTAWRFASEGRGTPSPTHETEDLVTGGVYAHLRNPMYVGVLLLIGGQAVRYKSLHVLWWAVVCWLGFHRRIIEYEEPRLLEAHGAAYEDYFEEVPRWVPRLHPPHDR
ncbi:isoprenylcysteine carboxylmethyltransferase family protein [Natronorubrum sp. JWXQ-INN-674]|uniref:Isoprenylcysteine carboxylmethyltransferase family protein n=1 Tax=Natronorubrum halalkaliphilum TaxID=2691917 RepID=A0A6B0VKZ4_9EURY|nr:isoprenylcysteine carboxylmethyltransferase family protein [Natronorubrum halalkaliphilum]MXV62511.1 isoprenylcysteine carboxylmethyltransferase family protein [Natronorubrum halalkaliphilum]